MCQPELLWIPVLHLRETLHPPILCCVQIYMQGRDSTIVHSGLTQHAPKDISAFLVVAYFSLNIIYATIKNKLISVNA